MCPSGPWAGSWPRPVLPGALCSLPGAQRLPRPRPFPVLSASPPGNRSGGSSGLEPSFSEAGLPRTQEVWRHGVVGWAASETTCGPRSRCSKGLRPWGQHQQQSHPRHSPSQGGARGTLRSGVSGLEGAARESHLQVKSGGWERKARPCRCCWPAHTWGDTGVSERGPAVGAFRPTLG